MYGRITFCIFILLCGINIAFAQDSSNVADSLSVTAKQDSLAAAFKMEALKQALADRPQQLAPVTYEPPDFGNIALRMFVGLAIILILLYILYRLARKMRGMDAPTNTLSTNIQLLESRFFGSGQKVHLVRIGAERVLVIGSSSDGMQTLSEITGEEAKIILSTHSANPPINAAQFSATVNHLLRGFRKDGGRT